MPAGLTAAWWQRRAGVRGNGPAVYADPEAAEWATVLKSWPMVSKLTRRARTGQNSGYQAINLAVHLGASRIVLLGYDMQPSPEGVDHFFGDHAHGVRVPFLDLRPYFDSLVEPLKALGVQVLNATRRTALSCFPCVPLSEALA
jgi:hypothetical protein